MPHQERIDAVERALLRVAATPELQGFAARIIEEGANPEDFAQLPGRRAATLFTSILIRAARPPFRLPIGEAVNWNIEGS